MNSLYKQCYKPSGNVVYYQFHRSTDSYWLIDGFNKRLLEPYGKLNDEQITLLFTRLKDLAGYTEDKPNEVSI